MQGCSLNKRVDVDDRKGKSSSFHRDILPPLDRPPFCLYKHPRSIKSMPHKHWAMLACFAALALSAPVATALAEDLTGRASAPSPLPFLEHCQALADRLLSCWWHQSPQLPLLAQWRSFSR